MFLLLTLLFGVSVLAAAEFQHDFAPRLLHNPTYAPLISALRTYQEQHSLEHINDSTTDPDFCNRRFAVVTYACPQMVGNRMHEFLNGYIGAFVSNRTMLWQFCTRKPCQLDNEDDCNQVLERFPWISSAWKFRQLWKHNKCEKSGEVVESLPPRFRYMADEVSMCCGLDEMENSVISFGTNDAHEFYGVSPPNARLTADGKLRAKLLFEHGENFGYGVLFRTAFRYRNNIIENNDRDLLAGGLSLRHTGATNTITQTLTETETSTDTPRPFVIGVHLRHTGNEEEKNVDGWGINCTNRVLREMNVAGPCVVLLASDRNETIQKWYNSDLIRCKIITSSHDKHHQAWSEHGPFTGVIAMRDIELVSRADVFIGCGYTHANLRERASTFSMLIAERQASSGGPYSPSVQARFMEHCKPMLAGRVFVSKISPLYHMYTNDTYFCPHRKNNEMPYPCFESLQA